MDDNIIVSRYTFLFRKEGLCFIFNSRTNSFYNINDETFDFLNQIKEGGGIPENADECFLSQLKDKKILTARGITSAAFTERTAGKVLKTLCSNIINPGSNKSLHVVTSLPEISLL